MKFVVISHVRHFKKNSEYLGYGPYVREMNIWLKYADEITIVAPLVEENPTAIDLAYTHSNIDFRKVPGFNFTNFSDSILALFKLPLIFGKVFWAMKQADHIHLRCPGNMGLIACLAQVFFPKKAKTAKYAGNWDSESKQPLTYNLQKWILSNTFLTRNMKVLVYGNWKNQSKNIMPFFTASYSDLEKEPIQKENTQSIVKFIFTGSLVKGKNPLYAVKLVEKLRKNGMNSNLDLYGEGDERQQLEDYIKENELDRFVVLHGNQNKETLKKAYQKSHFVILPSKSEGWPKTIAEGMFWGCIPLATKVSCVPFMLDYGKRGVLLTMEVKEDAAEVQSLVLNDIMFSEKSKLATDWSQYYTTDFFESQIKKLISGN